jgi:hypothetical protein
MRRALADGLAFAVCPRREDVPDPMLATAQIRTCDTCGKDVWVAPSTLQVIAATDRRWSIVCSHDLGRYKHLLEPGSHVPNPPSALRELAARVDGFAAARGIGPQEVILGLPPELLWLEERGVL